MDPVSLTAAVATLTFTCAKVTKCFHAIKSTYQTAPVTIITMIAECATVSASLNQIQSLALNDPVALSSRMSPADSLAKNFEDALTGCMLTLSVIEDELEGMVEGDQGAGTVGFKVKAKFVWNEATMEALLRQLRGQQTAIGLLIAVLQTESIAEVKDMVQKNAATLQTMLQRARTLRESKASRRGTIGGSAKPESIFSFGMSSTVAGLAPDLSQQLHQSPAYQKARAVEMEDLWRRNHELLQEKYTLLEKIEQLEEQEQKADEHLQAVKLKYKEDLEAAESEHNLYLRELHHEMKLEAADILKKLKTTESELEGKDRDIGYLRSSLNKEVMMHDELRAAFQQLREKTASRISLFENAVISAMKDHHTSTIAATKEREKFDALESQLSDRRRAHTTLVTSQQTELHNQLTSLLKSVRLKDRPVGEPKSRPDDEPEPGPDGKPEPGPDDESMYGAPMQVEEYQRYNPFREDEPAGLETDSSVYEEYHPSAGGEYVPNYRPTKETRPIDLPPPEENKLSPKERASSKPARREYRPPPKTFAEVFLSKRNRGRP